MTFRLCERQFTTVIGSDLDRDGMYLEVSEEKNGEPVVVLEIFYSDKSDKMTLSAFATDMPIELIDWATAMAKTRLPSSEKLDRKQ